jgi:large subunit ribosomal protein L35
VPNAQAETNKGAHKRLRITKSGRLKRGSPGKRHLTGGKSRKRLRRLRKAKFVAKTNSAASGACSA